MIDEAKMRRDLAAFRRKEEAAAAMLEALKYLTAQIDLSKLNVRKDFRTLLAHNGAMKAIALAEVAGIKAGEYSR
jgi:hypothetical protein